MPFFEKKPTVIEAIRYDGSLNSHNEIIRWMRESRTPGHAKHPSIRRRCGSDMADTEPTIMISTLEGIMSVEQGDWVIKGVQGEFYPCKPDIFEQTYEKDGRYDNG